MTTLCPHCQKTLHTVSSITNKTADNSNKYIDLRRCPACGNRLLYISTHTGEGAESICSESHITLLLEDAAMLTRFFYQCPSPMDRNCTCPAHKTAELFITAASSSERV